MINYLVTTRKEIVDKISGPIIMVDGTVPGWKARPIDVHYDHHRPGGKEIQIDEIPGGLIKIPDDCTIVTTMVDADACVAAAWVLLGKTPDKESIRKLRAIAYDCDHLAVPECLADLGKFAAEAVATLKQTSNELVDTLGLPADRKIWSIEQKEVFNSKAFMIGTEWLCDAVKGVRPWPGECGEAEEYWEGVRKNTQMIINEGRISVYRGCLLFDGKGLAGTYIDPRCWLKAAKSLGIEPANATTLTQREVFIDGVNKGFSYTLGVVPLHPGVKNIDYTIDIFKVLSTMEKTLNPKGGDWGGRKTVGGSAWNVPSLLSPQQIIDCVVAWSVLNH